MMRIANTGSIGFNGIMTARILARASSQVLIVLFGMGLCGTACEISSSGDDRQARLEKMQKIEEANRVNAKWERITLRERQAFKARYEGRIVPDLGCDVCPDMCEITDLRAMEADAFKSAYREAAFDRMSELAAYERQRLLCIARREPVLRDALAQLYNNPDEFPEVRLMAAQDAITEGFGSSEPRQALHEVAQGDDVVMSNVARGLIYAYEKRGWPDE